jgi:competence protein ComEA
MMKQSIRSFMAFVLSLFLFSSVAFAASGRANQGVMRGAVNINTATVEELQRLPGIGPKKAEDIIAFRDKHPFTRVSQFSKIKGIGPKTFKKLQPHITVDGPTDLQWVPEDKQTNCGVNQ